jgi:hypothetical protein
LTVTSHSDAQILVIDGKLQVVRRGVGNLAVDISPGLYKIKAARGGGTVEQLLNLRSDQHLDLPVNEFPSIAPIGPMLGADGQAVEQMAADALSRRFRPPGDAAANISDRSEEPGLLIVGHQRKEGAACSYPLNGLRVVPWDADSSALAIDEDSTTVKTVGSELWGAIWIPYRPGCYLLEISDGGQTVRQMVPVASGWQTRVFLRRRNWLDAGDVTSDVPRREWIDVSIQMSLKDRPVVYSDHFETIEVARNALQTTQPIFVSRHLIENLFYGKYDNPIAGITGLHLYLEALERSRSPKDGTAGNRELEIDPAWRDRPQDLSREVLGNLENLLTGVSTRPLSDIVALKVRAGLWPVNETAIISEPPMFWASWDCLRRNAGRDGPVWVDQGLWSSIARSNAWGPYLAWEPGQTSWRDLVDRQRAQSGIGKFAAVPQVLDEGGRLVQLERASVARSDPLALLDDTDLAAALGVPFSVTT